MTEYELKVIRARAEWVTPGPWTTLRNVAGNLTIHTADGTPVTRVGSAFDEKDQPYAYLCAFDRDVVFMAHAREDVPKLLDEIERLNRILKRLNRILT